MVYLATGSSDLILILGCMTSNLLALELFHILYSSSLWRTDTIIFSKLNKPTVSIKPPSPPPSNELEIKQASGRLKRGFTVLGNLNIIVLSPA